jgi:hypothetical protein
MTIHTLAETLSEANRRSKRLEEINKGLHFSLTTNKRTDKETTYRLALIQCTGPGHDRRPFIHGNEIVKAIKEGIHCVGFHKNERLRIIDEDTI